jgi:hypothetical protein
MYLMDSLIIRTTGVVASPEFSNGSHIFSGGGSTSAASVRENEKKNEKSMTTKILILLKCEGTIIFA